MKTTATEFDHFMDDLQALIDRYRKPIEQADQRELFNTLKLMRFRVIKPTPCAPKFEIITREVCAHFGIPLATIPSRHRPESIVHARQVCHYFARKLTFAPYEEIGTHYNRDHGTIMHNIRAAKTRMEINPTFRKSVAQIQIALGVALAQPSQLAA